MKSKSFFEIISPWIDRKHYAFTTFMVVAAIVMLYHSFSSDKVKSETDLISINGSLFDYSFTHGRKGSAMYYMRLSGYKCRFQIPANYLKFFNKPRFEIEANQGDEFEILIPKARANEVQLDTEIFVFQLKSGNSIYLNKNDTLQYEKGNSDIFMAIGFLIGGLIYYFIRRFFWRPSY